MTARLRLALAFVLWAGSARATTICIDPGHGGSDPGAIGFGHEEADFNLSEGLHFAAWLAADTGDPLGGGSWEVLMTRSADVSIGLQARCDMANNNGASRFMSIHNNAGGGDGTETYCYGGGSSASFDLRNRVQQRALFHLGTNDRGVKTANFYVLIHTAMPAELVEGVFMDTWDRNCALMSEDAIRRTMGLAQLHAVQQHYGLAFYTPTEAAAVPIAGRDSLAVLALGLGIAGMAFAYGMTRAAAS